MQGIYWKSLISSFSLIMNCLLFIWLRIIILNVFGWINQNIFILQKLIKSIIIVNYIKSFVQLHVLFKLFNSSLNFDIILSIRVFETSFTVQSRRLILWNRIIHRSIRETYVQIISYCFLLLFQQFLALYYLHSFSLPLLVVQPC